MMPFPHLLPSLLALCLLGTAAHAAEKKGGSCTVTFGPKLEMYHKKDIWTVKAGTSFSATYETTDTTARASIVEQCIKAARNQLGKPPESERDRIGMKNACEIKFNEVDPIVCSRSK